MEIVQDILNITFQTTEPATDKSFLGFYFFNSVGKNTKFVQILAVELLVRKF